MRVLKAAVVYFALVFGAGFVLGTLRVLWLVPVHRRSSVGARTAIALGIGLTALGLLLAAEIGLGLVLRGGSVQEILRGKDPVSGTVYYALLGVFALMPWLLARRATRSAGR